MTFGLPQGKVKFFGMDCCAWNSWALDTSSLGTLSRWRTYLSRQRTDFSQRISVTVSEKFSSMLVTSYHFVRTHNELSQCYNKEHTSMGFKLNWDMRAFFGRSDFFAFYCMLWHLLSGSHWTPHDSPLIIKVSNTFLFLKKSYEISVRRSFWSIKIRSTMFAIYFFSFSNPRLESIKLFMCACSVLLLSFTDLIFDLNATGFTLSTFASVLSFWLANFFFVIADSSHPSLNRLYRSKILNS